MTSTLGQTLRAAREAQGQSLDDVEGVTRIRAKHLAALESDNYAALPSPAQARGFLKNYAQYLGLDLQEVLGRYEAAQKGRGLGRPPRGLQATAVAAAKPAAPLPARRSQASVAAANPTPTREKLPPARPAAGPKQHIRVRRPRLLSADILVALVITGVLAGLLVWGGAQVAPNFFATPTSTGGALGLGTAAGTSAAGVTPTPAPPSATPPPPTPAQAFSGVNVIVLAELRSWVSVKVDGSEVFAGLMPPGEAREFVGQNVVEVTTGNGLGTRITWNGVDQGVLGDLGEVVTRLWTLQGELVPTATNTPEGQHGKSKDQAFSPRQPGLLKKHRRFGEHGPTPGRGRVSSHQ
jgi:cytoskeletal protein RodZ